MNRQIEEANRICDEMIAMDDPSYGGGCEAGHTRKWYANNARQIKELLTNGAGEPQKEVGLGFAEDAVKRLRDWEFAERSATDAPLPQRTNDIGCVLTRLEQLASLSQPPRGSVLAEELRKVATSLRLHDQDRKQESTPTQAADFIESVADRIERAAHAPKEGWVSVEERLPDDGQPVVIWHDVWGRLGFKYGGDPGFTGGGGKFDAEHPRGTRPRYSHWMPLLVKFPLPPAPSQDGEER